MKWFAGVEFVKLFDDVCFDFYLLGISSFHRIFVVPSCLGAPALSHVVPASVPQALRSRVSGVVSSAGLKVRPLHASRCGCLCQHLAAGLRRWITPDLSHTTPQSQREA